MQILGIYLYMTAVGFVAAGVLASFVQLVSGEPMRFGPSPQSILASIGAVLLLALAGPAVLMRNAWLGLQARPKVWFGISATIAAVWSLWFGALLVMLMLQLAS
jgi:branched-subunit amino acid transport protein